MLDDDAKISISFSLKPANESFRPYCYETDSRMIFKGQCSIPNSRDLKIASEEPMTMLWDKIFEGSSKNCYHQKLKLAKLALDDLLSSHQINKDETYSNALKELKSVLKKQKNLSKKEKCFDLSKYSDFPYEKNNFIVQQVQDNNYDSNTNEYVHADLLNQLVALQDMLQKAIDSMTKDSKRPFKEYPSPEGDQLKKELLDIINKVEILNTAAPISCCSLINKPHAHGSIKGYPVIVLQPNTEDTIPEKLPKNISIDKKLAPAETITDYPPEDEEVPTEDKPVSTAEASSLAAPTEEDANVQVDNSEDASVQASDNISVKSVKENFSQTLRSDITSKSLLTIKSTSTTSRTLCSDNCEALHDHRNSIPNQSASNVVEDQTNRPSITSLPSINEEDTNEELSNDDEYVYKASITSLPLDNEEDTNEIASNTDTLTKEISTSVTNIPEEETPPDDSIEPKEEAEVGYGVPTQTVPPESDNAEECREAGCLDILHQPCEACLKSKLKPDLVNTRQQTTQPFQGTATLPPEVIKSLKVIAINATNIVNQLKFLDQETQTNPATDSITFNIPSPDYSSITTQTKDSRTSRNGGSILIRKEGKINGSEDELKNRNSRSDDKNSTVVAAATINYNPGVPRPPSEITDCEDDNLIKSIKKSIIELQRNSELISSSGSSFNHRSFSKLRETQSKLVKDVGFQRIVNSAKSPRCTRETTLNEKINNALPYAASLRSLPLDDRDIEEIKKRLNRKSEDTTQVFTSLTEPCNYQQKLSRDNCDADCIKVGRTKHNLPAKEEIPDEDDRSLLFRYLWEELIRHSRRVNTNTKKIITQKPIDENFLTAERDIPMTNALMSSDFQVNKDPVTLLRKSTTRTLLTDRNCKPNTPELLVENNPSSRNPLIMSKKKLSKKLSHAESLLISRAKGLQFSRDSTKFSGSLTAKDNLGNEDRKQCEESSEIAERSTDATATSSETLVNPGSTIEELQRGYSDIQSITNQIKDCTTTLINNLKTIPNKKPSMKNEYYPNLRLRQQDSESLYSDVMYRMTEAHCTSESSEIAIELQRQLSAIRIIPPKKIESKKLPVNIAEKVRRKYHEFRKRSTSQKEKLRNIPMKGKCKKSRRPKSSSPTAQFEQKFIFKPSSKSSEGDMSSISYVTRRKDHHRTEESVKKSNHKSLKDLFMESRAKLRNSIFSDFEADKDILLESYSARSSNSTWQYNIQFGPPDQNVDYTNKKRVHSKQTLIDEAIELATDMTLRYLLKGSKKLQYPPSSGHERDDDSTYYDTNYVSVKKSYYLNKPFDIKKKPLNISQTQTLKPSYSQPTEHMDLLKDMEQEDLENSELLNNVMDNSKELLRTNGDNDMCETLAMLVKNLYAVKHKIMESKKKYNQNIEYVMEEQQNVYHKSNEELLYTVDYNEFLQNQQKANEKEIKQEFDNKIKGQKSPEYKPRKIIYCDTTGTQTAVTHAPHFRSVGNNTSNKEITIKQTEKKEILSKPKAEKVHRTKSSRKRDREKKHTHKRSATVEPEPKTNKIKSSKGRSQITQLTFSTEILYKKSDDVKPEENSSRWFDGHFRCPPTVILDTETRNWQTIGEMLTNRLPPAQQKNRDIIAANNYYKQGSLLNMKEILLRNLDDPRTLKLNGRRLRQIRCPVVLTKLAQFAK